MAATTPRGRVRTAGRASKVHIPRSARVLALVSMTLLSACGTLSGAATTSPVRADSAAGEGFATAGSVTSDLASFYRAPVPLAPEPPGAVIRSMVIPSAGLLPRGAVAYRVLYHSETLTGEDTAVSGMVVVPGGAAPASGFPIVSWAHGTTGLADQCAPSLDGVTSIPLLDSLLSRGYIVAATDYEGLGTPGDHPYLVGQSEGQDVLDAARAARNLVGRDASNVVAVLGYSQGGQAALFASQIAPSYAPELFIAGTAAAAPVTSLGEFVPPGTASDDDQAAVYAVMALDAWAGTYGNLALASVLTPAALRRASVMTSECSGAAAAVFDTVEAGQLFTPGWSQNPSVQADELDNQPGRTPTATPLLVVEGTDDTLTPTATVSSFVTGTLCRADDDTVEYVTVPGAGHGGAVEGGAPAILAWISARLAGGRAPDSCPSLTRSRYGLSDG